MNSVYCIANFNSTKWNKEKLRIELKKIQGLNKELNCNFYIPTTQIENKNASWKAYEFTFIEKFKDEQSFNEHCEQEYVKKFFSENNHLILNTNITLHKEL
jgi:quinol monooxygenase YgiN